MSTGLDGLDALLGGLYWGDNVVWECSGVSVEPFYRAIASSGEQFDSRTWVRVGGASEALGSPEAAGAQGQARPLAVCDEPPGQAAPRGGGERAGTIGASGRSEPPDPVALLGEIRRLCQPHMRRLLLFDPLERMVEAWGPGGARGFFARCCPLLLEVGAIAYWSLDMDRTPPMVRSAVEAVTQCVLRIDERRLTVIKAEGRDERVKGSVLHWHAEDGLPVLAPAELVGRIAASLRQLRRARRLSQHELADLAGVTASAISQAERGERGLSLATLLRLCSALEIKLDDLLRGEEPDSYRIGRLVVDPAHGVAQTATLLDGTGEVHIDLVRIGAHQTGRPAGRLEGRGIVAVADGLVQVLIDPHAPVVRRGEVVLTDASRVRGWRNLGRGDATLFWIVVPTLGR